MMKLLVFREHLKKIYSSYGTYIDMALKAVSVMIAMAVINSKIGYMERLKSPVIVILFGIMAAFLPNGINILLLSAVIAAHLYQLSMELTVVTLAILLFMYLIYYRFTPKDSYILILLPVLFWFKLPYIVPLIVGLVGNPVSVISIAFGTVLYYIMLYAKDNAAAITNVTDDTGVQKITGLLDSILKNREMWIMLVTFAVVVLLVYFIRRRSIDYAWTIAIVAGGIVNILVILMGRLAYSKAISISIPVMVTATALSMGIAYILHLMILSIDYSRTEYVQFEDDEYYYYVKAVPKITVATQDVTVKRINARKHRKSRNDKSR